MLGPLVPLAFGAIFAGLLFHRLFIGAGHGVVRGESLFYAADQPRHRGQGERPGSSASCRC